MTPVKYNIPFVFHFRPQPQCECDECSKKFIPCRGGLTVVFDPTVRKFGVSRCSYKDNYSRKDGVARAKKRAKCTEETDNFITRVVKDLGISDDEFFVETIRQKAKEIASQFGY